MRIIRVAVCQLESHPAVYPSHIAYLEEPFVPDSDDSLSLLSTKGLDVESLQKICAKDYVALQDARIQGVLDFLTRLDRPPDVVLFPEGCVPAQSLPILSEWSAKTGATVLAGSHSLDGRPLGRKSYRQIGVGEQRLNRLAKQSDAQLMPLFRAGKVELVRKRLPSPFEKSLVSREERSIPTFRPFSVECNAGQLALLPLVCSEALQQHNVASVYDLTAIISYDKTPSQFQTLITQEVRNKRVVAYCNDGAYGGSGIFSSRDIRIPDWLAAVLPNGLPPGDSILVSDVDLDVPAVEVGTTTPSKAQTLVALVAVVCDSSDPGFVAKELESIAKLPDPLTGPGR